MLITETLITAAGNNLQKILLRNFCLLKNLSFHEIFVLQKFGTIQYSCIALGIATHYLQLASYEEFVSLNRQ